MFNSVAYWALLGAEGWVKLSEEQGPIVTVEYLTGLVVDIDDPLRRFDLVLGPLECDERGIHGLAWRPVIDADGTTSWRNSGIAGGIAPNGWQQWLEYLEGKGVDRAAVLASTDPNSIFLWFAFQDWARERRGEQLAQLLADGDATMETIKLVARGAMDTDAFRRCVADLTIHAALPKGRVGRPNTKTERVKRSVVELGALAASIRRDQPRLSLMASYEQACRMRPGWVLPTWRNGDPAYRLGEEIGKLRGTRYVGWFDHI